MRWNAGPSPEEHFKRSQEWHPWFAWRPVRIKRELIWLEVIERRGTFHWECLGTYAWRWSWEYRNPGNATPYVCSDFHPDRDTPFYCEGCKQLKSAHKEIEPC